MAAWLGAEHGWRGSLGFFPMPTHPEVFIQGWEKQGFLGVFARQPRELRPFPSGPHFAFPSEAPLPHPQR